MNCAVSQKYVEDSESDENTLRFHHDTPAISHYSAEGTFDRVSRRYYWTGMRKYITYYIKDCIECK